ncbi:MAG: hypothetical protein CVU12_08155 [Bacteroidetes bacterium HGW-Bacteroidetes-7]|jgi:hypothetical protein|nr:MAG: hypothetical protein CVU12_08155 [Bacteroidetes bacterium HGW-Bacteroidetes-7]
MNSIDISCSSLTALNFEESCRITGGSDGWDYDIANAVGRGVGYGVKKMWRLFKFLSNNMYEMQANTQVIYK